MGNDIKHKTVTLARDVVRLHKVIGLSVENLDYTYILMRCSRVQSKSWVKERKAIATQQEGSRTGNCRRMGHALSIVLYTALFAVPAYISYRLILGAGTIPSTTRVPAEDTDRELKSVMQPPRTDLEDPKSDPFTLEELREYDGSVPGKPIYVAIKGSCCLII